MNSDPEVIKQALESDKSLREAWIKARLDQQMLQQVPKNLKNRYILDTKQQRKQELYVKGVNSLIERTMEKVQDLNRARSLLSNGSKAEMLRNASCDIEDLSSRSHEYA